MRKYCCIPVLTCLGLTVSVASQSASAQVISEAFDNVPALPAGWSNINQSFPNPSTTAAWFQGNSAAFVAQAGAANAYAASNFQCISTGTGTHNTWLLTPAVSLVNGQVLKFWTRCPTALVYPDRLQVRLSLAGASGNVGTVGMPDTVGDFSALLLDINPTLVNGVYPAVWTEQTIVISGVPSPTLGRIGLRYYVTGGGPTGANGNYIGVDTLSLSGPPTCADPLPACPADVFPVAGGNGTVDIDDLVKVITTWGQDNTSSGGPRPDADCAPGATGDCRVNIDDLVKVITSWGDCKGACCLSNGSCSPNQSQAQCTAANGTYQGHDVLCANVVCPIPPANDNCAQRINANNGNNAFNNANANTDGPAVALTCAPAPGGTRDVWFNYTATCNGHVTFDTLATATPFTDTIIQVFNGISCPPSALLGCNDDVGTSNFLSSLTVTLTLGQVVKVRVMSWATAATNQGAGVLNIACVPINDDLCGDAGFIAVPSTTNGTVLNTTQDVAPLCNGVAPGSGRWYKVVGADTILTACTCDSLLEGWDAKISVYCGSSCSDLFCVAASGALDCGGAGSGVPGCSNIPASVGFGLHENVTWCAKLGQTYWILVSAQSVPLSPEGGYVLKITSGASCVSVIQCFIPGDECSSANTLPALALGSNAGSNVDMTTSGQLATCVGAGFCSEDVWRTFTPASTNSYTMTLCATPTSWDSVLAIYSGTCGSLTQVACDDDGCGGVGVPSIVSATLNGGTTYYVRVGTWGADPQTGVAWTLNISIPAGCGACVGTAEGAPTCQVDGTPTANDPNGGCGAVPFAFPQTVTVGTTICGQGNYYTTGGSGFRDTDWYLFTPATDGKYRVTICADFPATVRVYRNYDMSLVNCTTCTGPLAALDALAAALTPTDVDRSLTGGVTYAIFIAPQVGLGTLACGNYRFSVSSQGACPAWAAPGGAVASVDTLCHLNGETIVNDPDGGCNASPTVFSTITVGTASTGTLSTFISATNACTRDIDWYQFIAPSTGNYTLTVNSEVTFVSQILTGTNPAGTACGTLGAVLNSTINSATCGQVVSGPIALTAGTRYAILVTSGYFFGQPCVAGANRYWVRITTP